ncbi:uncharacterized protein [Porites lutea]|uniref:uncharacterized protein n=1 Tax=Porites lutea TaxID=51062 RepID=UPI003CC6881E
MLFWLLVVILVSLNGITEGAATLTRSTRPGICPMFVTPECPEEQEHFCLSDDGCPTGLKCCNTGCELDCVVPVDLPEENKTNISPTVPVTALTRSTRPGTCPMFVPPPECPEEVHNFCSSDDGCPTGLKCCNMGCELDCVVPDNLPEEIKTNILPTVPETAALKTRSPRPGKCPVFQAALECPEEVKHFCSSDDGCPTGLKCCKKGCDELDCVVPDFKGIKTNISPTVSQTDLKGIKTKLPTKAPKTGDIRLVNGFRREEGRVEIFHNGEWGTVCDDWWDIQAANVACRHLGFFGARRAIRKAYFGPGSVPILLDNVRCRGDENSLGDCSHNGWGKHNCGHYEDASVVCETREFGPPHPGKCPDFPPPAECPSVKKDLCSADDYCPTGQKCCYTGCELDCVGSE